MKANTAASAAYNKDHTSNFLPIFVKDNRSLILFMMTKCLRTVMALCVNILVMWMMSFLELAPSRME